jgi:competence protein ComEA
MANGYFERGEIYWVSLGNGFTDIEVTRPGLIVSCEKVNRSGQVIMVFLTTKERTDSKDVFTEITGKPSWIKCDNITTISTNKLGKHIGTLNSDDMRSVEDALDEVFDLYYVDDSSIKEKENEIAALKLQMEELKAENAELKKKDSAHDDELIARDVEIAVAKRMYEKAIGVIAAMRAEPDLPTPPERQRKVDPPKMPEPPKAVEEPTGLVDINTAKFSELRSVGFSSNVVLTIINNRPYAKIEDIKKLQGVNSAMFGIVQNKLCCTPVEPPKPAEPPKAVEPVVEKVNINTATAKEIMAGLGVGNNAAYSITAYRNKNGLFKSLNELLELPYWSEKMLAKHRDKLEV